MIYKYYEATSDIINLSIEVGRLLGVVDTTFLTKPKTELRKRNKVKTIRASLAIEGNSLTEEQITAILDNKRVLGSVKEIKEVENAIAAYDILDTFDPFSEQSFLHAHKLLMTGLVEGAGTYRAKAVGVVHDNKIAHLAPPGWNIPHLMGSLFEYLKLSEDNLLIKSCVFHYETEFIHPFYDGNGRMGRLWQTVILMKLNPVFAYLPIEKEIKDTQEDYYRVLSESDKEGLSTPFIIYILEKIKDSLQDLVDSNSKPLTDIERLHHFKERYTDKTFNRQDYLRHFPNISSATATRDLGKGVTLDMLEKTGSNRLTQYRFK